MTGVAPFMYILGVAPLSQDATTNQDGAPYDRYKWGEKRPSYRNATRTYRNIVKPPIIMASQPTPP